jgi:hypothetical protein
MIIPIKKIILEGLNNSNSIRVYHGTSPEYKEDILQNGMRISRAGKGNDSSIKKLDKDIQDVSGNRNYTTTSKFQAASYAAQHDNGLRLSPDQIKGSKTLKSLATNDGIVQIDIPKNFDQKHRVINPEYATIMSKAKDGIIPTIKAMRAGGAFKNDRVYNKDIPTEFIKGSKNYNPNSEAYKIPTNQTNPLRDSSVRDSAVRGRTKKIRNNEKYVAKAKAITAGVGLTGTTAGLYGLSKLVD